MAPFLIPFLKMSCVYFVLDLSDQPSLTAAFVKALPVLSLAWLVCLQGVGLGEPISQYITYNRRILCGLLLSSIGDAVLIWQKEEIYFIIGLLCFACAQLCYIVAFGFSPFGLKEMVLCYSAVTVVMVGVYPCLQTMTLSCGVSAYALLITTMSWRSLARFNLRGDIPWRKIFSAVGALLFAMSDIILAVNKFCFAVPFEHALIMTTYYGAQLCIALSVINYHHHGNQTHANGVVPVQSSSFLLSPSLRRRTSQLSVQACISPVGSIKTDI